MSSVDLGLFDYIVTDKPTSTLDEFESLLYDSTARNILDISLQETGVSNNNTMGTFNVSIHISMFYFKPSYSPAK